MKKKSPRRKIDNAPRRLSYKERTEELQAFIYLCYSLLDGDDTLRGVIEASGLSRTTIYRLRRGRASLYTHYGTVQALGYAVGLHLEMAEYSVKVRVIG